MDDRRPSFVLTVIIPCAMATLTALTVMTPSIHSSTTIGDRVIAWVFVYCGILIIDLCLFHGYCFFKSIFRKKP